MARWRIKRIFAENVERIRHEQPRFGVVGPQSDDMLGELSCTECIAKCHGAARLYHHAIDTAVVGQIIPLTHRAFWSDYLPGETTDVVD